MKKYFMLPLLVLKFWYYESVISLLRFYASVNRAFCLLFSLPIFIKTFFKPLKNEYRDGLIGFSIGMGIAIKSAFIFVDLFVLAILLILEAAILLIFVAFPIATAYLLVA